MIPGVYNITAKQGATFVFSVNWKDAVTGLAMDLTGFTARLVVRYKPDSPMALLDLSTSNGKIVLGGSPYNVVVSETREAMAALPAGTYVYDLEMSGGADDYPLLTGRFNLAGSTVR